MLLNRKMMLIVLLILLLCFTVLGCENTKDNGLKSLNGEIENIKNLNTRINEENDILNTQNNELKESLQAAKETIAELQDDINDIQKQLDAKQYEMFPPAISYSYGNQDYTDFLVFIEEENFIRILPYDNAQEINYVFEKSLVKVLDKAQVQIHDEVDNDSFWYYVEITVFDTPLNQKGWLRVEETIPYTKENQPNVLSPITVKEGSKIYETDGPLSDNIKYTLSRYEHGRIREFHDGYARIMAAGGRSYWTKAENIVYPEIKE